MSTTPKTRLNVNLLKSVTHDNAYYRTDSHPIVITKPKKKSVARHGTVQRIQSIARPFLLAASIALAANYTPTRHTHLDTRKPFTQFFADNSRMEYRREAVEKKESQLELYITKDAPTPALIDSIVGEHAARYGYSPNVTDFLKKASYLSTIKEQKTGSSLAGLLAVAVNETRAGSSDLFHRSYNAFSFKAAESPAMKRKHPHNIEMKTWEYTPANHTTAKFRKYNSLQESFDDMEEVMCSFSVYKSVCGESDPVRFIRAIVASPFASHKKEVQYKAIMNKYREFHLGELANDIHSAMTKVRQRNSLAQYIAAE